MKRKRCLFCDKVIDNPKFCNHSCAASYNNNLRGKQFHSEETKRKISESISSYYETVSKEYLSKRSLGGWQNNPRKRKLRFCKICSIKISFTNKYDYCRKHWFESEEFQKVMGHYNKNYKKGYVYNKWTDTYEYLQSSLEFLYYDYLTKNNIRWIRPKPFKYILNGTNHLYFPDFYLLNSKEYIEIKGYMWEKDKLKMKTVKEQYSNETFLLFKKKDLLQLI